MPEISVCLPVFNGEQFLAAALDSVLAQTFADFEVIVVDDCSTDGSLAIAQAYASRDPRVKVQKNERNLGLFANYNRCIQFASGTYIKLFAQDDVFAPTILERQLEAFAGNQNVKLVACAKQWIGSDGSQIKVIQTFSETRMIPGKDVIRYNMAQLGNWVGEPSTVMFRRADAGSGFDVELYHYGDIDYWFRIVENGSLVYLSDVLCSFRRHEDSTTTKNLSGLYFVLDMIRMGKKYRPYCEELGETEPHFTHRMLELAARHVHHLAANDQINAETVTALPSVDPAVVPSVGATPGVALATEQARELQAFKELSFQALTYLGDLLRERHSLLCTINDLDEMVHDVRANAWWQATRPLRKLSGKQVPGIDPEIEKVSSGKPAAGVVVSSS